jgi:hypothetical protein
MPKNIGNSKISFKQTNLLKSFNMQSLGKNIDYLKGQFHKTAIRKDHGMLVYVGFDHEQLMVFKIFLIETSIPVIFSRFSFT